MPFKSNNAAVGLPDGDKFQQGQSDIDDNSAIEQGIRIPWSSDPASSYVYYDCTISVMLDSGIVVHNRLPQVNRAADSLTSGFLDDPDLDGNTAGVSLQCRDQYTDIVQRMGHARYWFRLWGQALRIGYKIPIPGIKTIGGVPAIPYDKNPQWGYNRIVPGGNYSGVPLWHAQWSLWYTTAVPPTSNDIPVRDLSGHISGDDPLPTDLQSPWSQADDDAQTGPPAPLQFFTGTK